MQSAREGGIALPESDDSVSNEIGRQHNDGHFIIETHLTIDEMAHLLGVGPELVRRYVIRKRWPHIRQPVRGGYRAMFCEHDISDIVARFEVAGEDPQRGLRVV